MVLSSLALKGVIENLKLSIEIRFDATQAIHDSSDPHILAEISRRVRAAAGKRGTLIFSENERQEAVQIRSEKAGGHGLDGA